MSTEDKKWIIKHRQAGIDDECQELELSYEYESDLFTLKTKSWDYNEEDDTTWGEILFYPKDLQEVSKLISMAMKECEGAGRL